MAIPWILISIAILVVILAVLFLLIKQKKKRAPDYYAFFVMGIIWLPAGILFQNYALAIMGLIFALVGIVNKNKWKKNRLTWDKLTKEERKMRMIIFIILGVLFLVGIIVLLIMAK